MRQRRRRPALLVYVPLEGRAVVYLDADSYEDEWRLRRWLRRSRALPLALLRLIDELGLDADDREAA